MRAPWLAGAAALAVLLVVVGRSWPQRLLGGVAIPQGLVTEEDVYGHGVPDGPEEEEAVLLAARRHRPGFGLGAAADGTAAAVGPLRRLCAALSNRLSRWLRLDELQRGPRRRRGMPAGSAENLEGTREPIHEALLIVAICLKLVGALLAALVPSAVVAYWLLSQPLALPRHLGPAVALLDGPLAALEKPALPVLVAAGRALGLGRAEVLGEDSSGPEVLRRAKRVLLALLVVNVGASAAAALSLAVLVLAVRLAGSER